MSGNRKLGRAASTLVAGWCAQLAALRKLTRDDVNRAANRYLDPSNIVIAVAGPMKIIQENAAAEERALVGAR